jgi:DNA-directed DNA polymerase III PolC
LVTSFYCFTHSYYSLLEGVPSPEELAAQAARFEMPALGLADHGLLSGAVAFTRACREKGIQPLYGLEFDLLPRVQAQVLACGPAGWSNLCRLSSALQLEQPSGNKLFESLQTYGQDLLLAIPPEAGNLFGPLRELFPGRAYVVMSHPHEPTAELAKHWSLPLLAAPPVYTLTPEQADLQRTLAAVRLTCPRSKLPAAAAAPAGSWFLPPGEISARFKNYPAALAAQAEIAARCQIEFPLGGVRPPHIPLPPGTNASQLLRQKAEAGARRLYGQMSEAIQARLDHELQAISQLGFESVFLIVEEILDFARRSGVPSSSRGSAASSLVAHCLGITSPDPLRLDLYFERFINPARSKPPDIDTDLCSRERDRVIQHVFETYGEDYVSMVSTINHFRPRSALGDAAKAFGLTPAAVRQLVEPLPSSFFSMRFGEGQTGAVYDDLRRSYPQHALIFDHAAAMLRLPRHFSVHAGGLIVAPEPIRGVAPLMRSGSKGVTITQMDLEAVEALGLVKIDLLGIRGLTVLGDVARKIYSWQRCDYCGVLDVLETIPLDDPETADIVEQARTIGCFQIESPGMRSVLRDIRARRVDDIMAALALFRPGPLKGGLRDSFVRRFKGEEAVTYLHPSLAPLLSETYGVVLYQEQVLRIAHQVAGFSLVEADLLRRAMSHFDEEGQMKILRQKFVESAQKRSGVDPETGQHIWDLMAAFAGYGFNKAHAASYALAAWRSAWCKAHYPAEFMAAVMANWGGYYSQRVYLNEARRMGLVVRPPLVNFARSQFEVLYPGGEPVLYMGLDQVRDLTQRTQQRIMQLRPFNSLEDFLTRVDPRRQEAENLALAGSLDGLANLPDALQRIRGGNWVVNQPSLFELEQPTGQDWTPEQKAAAQQEVLGISLSAHPLELAAGRAAAAGAISTLEAAGQVGKRVRVAAVRQSWRRSRTARGETMAFVTLEDLEGTLDMVVFPDVYRRARSLLMEARPLLISGLVEDDPDRPDPLLRAEDIRAL